MAVELSLATIPNQAMVGRREFFHSTSMSIALITPLQRISVLEVGDFLQTIPVICFEIPIRDCQNIFNLRNGFGARDDRCNSTISKKPSSGKLARRLPSNFSQFN